MADVNGDDHLDLLEYVVACHVMTRHLKLKLPIPDAVPPELLASARVRLSSVPPSPAARPTAAPAPPEMPAGPWSITVEDMTQYKTMFASVDVAKAGKVNAQGSQLSRSGLPAPSLMQIWKCVPFAPCRLACV